MYILLILSSIGVLIAIFIILHLLQKSRLSNRQIKNLEHQLNISNNNIDALTEELAEARAGNLLTERISLICKQSPNAIMLMDAEGNIDWVNQGFERMYEHSYESFTEALGTNIRKTSFNPKIQERLRRCGNGETVMYDALNITRTGKEIWTRTALVPLFDENKNVISMVTIDTDIHKLKLAGDQLAANTIQLRDQLQLIEGQFGNLLSLITDLFKAIEESQKLFVETDSIINLIKEISDQTKILGINASIEAYAAGEAGKGFRVISNEIVRVSEATKSSAVKIVEILRSVKKSTTLVDSEKAVTELALKEHKKMIEEFTVEIQEIEELVEVLKVD